jgi:hypothetical protein
MKGLAAILATLALSATSASAQVQITSGGPQNTAFGTDTIVRVTLSFRAAIEGADPRTMPDQKAQETARRSVYDMAVNECTALSESFKAECRLASLQIFGALVPAPNAIPAGPGLNATALYELKPKNAVPAR